jgi:hypothetical protein
VNPSCQLMPWMEKAALVPVAAAIRQGQDYCAHHHKPPKKEAVIGNQREKNPSSPEPSAPPAAIVGFSGLIVLLSVYWLTAV